MCNICFCIYSTQLFREFKLCKLLLRPLDDRYSASRGSSHQIRGYSRQSESYVSSLSNSADNSANDGIDDEDFAFEGQYNASQLFKYQRPGSRALSVPAPITHTFGKYIFLATRVMFFTKINISLVRTKKLRSSSDKAYIFPS